MATNLTVNGVTYAYPEDGDTAGWGAAATNWASAVTAGMLQKAGGTFTLTAEVDFGASYGIKSLYYKTRSATIASAGQFRLANTDVVSWRNNGDTADLDLGPGTDDVLEFNGVDLVDVSSTQTLTNKTITLSGNLTTTLTEGSIPFIGAGGVLSEDNTNLNWDDATNTLTLGGDLVTAPGDIEVGDPGLESAGININGVTYDPRIRVHDIGGTAPAQVVLHRHSTILPSIIVGSRANSDTNSHTAVTNDQSLFSLYSAGWSGTHYDLFGTIDFKVDSAGTISSSSSPGAIVFSTTADGFQTPTERMRINSAGGVSFSALTATTVPYLDANKVLTSSAVTPTELGYVSGVTSAIQTQLNGKVDVAGDTMTGFLTLNADPTSALHAATKQYVDAAIGAPALNDVTDVVITTPADNEVLAYDNGSGNWINQTAAEAGLATASDLTTHTGSTSNPHSTSLSNLTDTTITGGAKGDLLVHNGTAWVDLTVGTDGYVLTASSAATEGVAWSAAAGGGSDFFVDDGTTPTTTPTVTSSTDGLAIGSGAVTTTGADAISVGKSYASGAGSIAIQIGNSTSSYGAQGPKAIAIGDTAKVTTANGTANAVFGGQINSITGTGVSDANTIVGGWTNTINANGGGDQNTIVGGDSQTITITGNSFNNSIFGGVSNSVTGVLSGSTHTIVGGDTNSITSTTTGSANIIAGGYSHSLNSLTGSYQGVFAGYDNSITNTNWSAAIVGGQANSISSSGALNCIVGGYQNAISSSSHDQAIVGGELNTISSSDADNAILGGYGNTIGGTGYGNVVLGGDSNSSGALDSAVLATVTTGFNGAAVMNGSFAMGAGGQAGPGDSQSGLLTIQTSTSTATPTTIRFNGPFAGTSSDYINIPNNCTMAFEALIVARRTDVDGENAGYKLEGVIKRDGTAATTAIVGSVTKTVLAEDTAAWDVNAAADTTNGRLNITVTGEAAKTIYWSGSVRFAMTIG